MRNRFLAVVLGLSLAAYACAQQPKLVLAIVIDQFRYDYLTRFRAEYTGGLKRMLDQGADFTNASYQHVPTVTAVGHSTVLTGATPALSGIIGNVGLVGPALHRRVRHQRLRPRAKPIY